jgi:hypothetical protein
MLHGRSEAANCCSTGLLQEMGHGQCLTNKAMGTPAPADSVVEHQWKSVHHSRTPALPVQWGEGTKRGTKTGTKRGTKLARLMGKPFKGRTNTVVVQPRATVRLLRVLSVSCGRVNG